MGLQGRERSLMISLSATKAITALCRASRW